MLTTACSYDKEQQLLSVVVELSAPDAVDATLLGGISVSMTDANATVTVSQTDETGKALFHIPPGIYHVSASAIVENNDEQYIINGNIAQFIVSSNSTKDASSNILAQAPVVITKKGAHGIIIKEVYCGGCQKDDGSGIFSYDKCIILYNNSPYDTDIKHLAIGMIEPYNAEATTHSFLNGGVLDYESTGIIPCINGIWYFPDTLHINAYEEVVVNVHGAIDNTKTYSNSINYSDSRYYCMYDPATIGGDGKFYNNTSYYPAPSEVIPVSHYLRTAKYGSGNAWPMSQTSPAIVLFQTKDSAPEVFCNDESNIIYPTGKQGNRAYACLAVPRAWVLDGIEIYNSSKLASCKKRLTSDIDNGYVTLTNGYGHSLIRRIDEEATRKHGHDIYIDTNNSTNDFIESEQCSLK